MNQRYDIFLGFRIFCLLMALNVINLSIDVRDTPMLTSKTTENSKDVSINKIESIRELLLEEFFGIRDATLDHDDPDKESELTELEQDYEFTPLFAFSPLSSPVQHLLRFGRGFRIHRKC